MSSTIEFKVDADSLNLRSAPAVLDKNIIAVLHRGQAVTKLGDTASPDWWKVSVVIEDIPVEGYLNHKFLASTTAFSDPVTHTGITAVDLSPDGLQITRQQTNGRAYPLNEPGGPRRDPAADGTINVNQLTAIINWLDVEHSARYAVSHNTTFCNIYAYDYCYLAKAYLPRVWWTRSAIAKLSAGSAMPIIYEQTVTELNANSLFNWLKEFGSDFGWRRTFDLTEIQAAADAGGVGIICAKRADLNRPGHICAVVPEAADHKAVRVGNDITKPLQSQAGGHNYSYIARVWWLDGKFREFGFWVHA